MFTVIIKYLLIFVAGWFFGWFFHSPIPEEDIPEVLEDVKPTATTRSPIFRAATGARSTNSNKELK